MIFYEKQKSIYFYYYQKEDFKSIQNLRT